MRLFLNQIFRLGTLFNFLDISGPVKEVVGVTSTSAGSS